MNGGVREPSEASATHRPRLGKQMKKPGLLYGLRPEIRSC